MKLYNPLHSGVIIKGLWLEPMTISITQAAEAMGISRKTCRKLSDDRSRKRFGHPDPVRQGGACPGEAVAGVDVAMFVPCYHI
ncbi:hypothetical protein GC175_04695 [bacterium]|nr:hypothetical protein [bacterium]